MKQAEIELECKRLATCADHEMELMAFVRTVRRETARECSEMAEVYDYEDAGYEIRRHFGLMDDDDAEVVP